MTPFNWMWWIKKSSPSSFASYVIIRKDILRIKSRRMIKWERKIDLNSLKRFIFNCLIFNENFRMEKKSINRIYASSTVFRDSRQKNPSPNLHKSYYFATPSWHFSEIFIGKLKIYEKPLAIKCFAIGEQFATDTGLISSYGDKRRNKNIVFPPDCTYFSHHHLLNHRCNTLLRLKIYCGCRLDAIQCKKRNCAHMTLSKSISSEKRRRK